MECRYRATAGLRLREFDDGTLVFSPRTWDVHILNPAAAALLAHCRLQAGTTADMARMLEEALTEDERPRASEHVSRLVEELGALGLIERVPHDEAG